jgi:hypothetical protein
LLLECAVDASSAVEDPGQLAWIIRIVAAGALSPSRLVPHRATPGRPPGHWPGSSWSPSPSGGSLGS